jgi:hypothetical protein
MFATSATIVPGHFVQVVSAEIGGPVKGAIRAVSGFGACAGVVWSDIVVFVVGVVSSSAEIVFRVVIKHGGMGEIEHARGGGIVWIGRRQWIQVIIVVCD